jgi:hypothetical protein
MDARHAGLPERQMSAIGFNRDLRGIDIALTQINNFRRCDLQMRLLVDTNDFSDATIRKESQIVSGCAATAVMTIFGSDHRHQLRRIDRFDEIPVEAGGNGAHAVFRLTVA